MSDNIDLGRFLAAQARQYDAALAEIKRGCKATHWMWFVFPQHLGLGKSKTAIYYGIRDLDEARAYLSHDLLGPRLIEISSALLAAPQTNAVKIFGSIDAMKLKSSMTLFSLADPNIRVFMNVLAKFFAGALDEGTLALLAQSGSPDAMQKAARKDQAAANSIAAF